MDPVGPMQVLLWLIVVVLLLLFSAAILLLGRRLERRSQGHHSLSAVSRQHIDLFQGGQLSESAVESAKQRFRELLERGEFERVEASLRPGTQYVVQVRALAELGTEDAGRILERQLARRLTNDQIEQAWYWIDLASGLRSLNRSQSLPHLLRCAESAGSLPLGYFFAAETVCFLGFSGYVRQHDTPLGQSALRTLYRSLEGLRSGVPPHVVAEGRLGEMIEMLWDERPDTIDPLLIRVFAETLRLVRRAPHAEAVLSSDGPEVEAYHWQVSRLASLEPALRDYLDEAPELLRTALASVPEEEHPDYLGALNDLRADAAPIVLPLLANPRYPHAELAVDGLRWSRDPSVAPALLAWIYRRLALDRRVQKRRRSAPPHRSSVPADLPYRAILRTLRGHPSARTEAFLLLASRDWDPIYRHAAISSLGWWEPVQRGELLVRLQEARRDPCADVRQAARAALARQGERQALEWFRQMLHSEESQRVHEGIQTVAAEELYLLWPDLENLADSEDLDVAHHAREALERLCEEIDTRLQ